MRVRVAAVVLLAAVPMVLIGSQATADPPLKPTPRAACGLGSDPEIGRQGRVTYAEIESGRAARPYTCNTRQAGHFGTTGGYKVYRYVDKAGHECAYYDTTLLYPGNLLTDEDLPGTYVLDMADPAKPVMTETLLTPAFQSPHESVNLNEKRGLLAAAFANPVAYPGQVDLYDVSGDCRHPVLKASAPVGVLGHESGFALDGNTLYVASLYGGTLAAVDVSNPSAPVTLWAANYQSHGLSLNDAGTRAYVAVRTGLGPNGDLAGMVILDTTQIQQRVLNPQVPVVTTLTWDTVSTPQITIPVTIKGRRYLVEMDEFGSEQVGAARIIDIADESKPKVVSNIRLEVNMAENRASQLADPGATTRFKGYTGHYCSVPREVEPEVVACTFILSGMRLFDIRDPLAPKEIAYFNPPIQGNGLGDGNYAMSSVAFVPERGELWYADGNSGFYNVKVTNGVWPFPKQAAEGRPRSDAAPAAVAAPSSQETTPATGGAAPAAALAVLALWWVTHRLRSRAA